MRRSTGVLMALIIASLLLGVMIATPPRARASLPDPSLWPGGTTQTTLQVVSQNGFSGCVSLSGVVSPAPSVGSITPTFNPASVCITPTQAATTVMTVTTTGSPETSAGQYIVTVSGQSSTIIKTLQIALTVNPIVNVNAVGLVSGVAGTAVTINGTTYSAAQALAGINVYQVYGTTLSVQWGLSLSSSTATYAWQSSSGLLTSSSGTITATANGGITANYGTSSSIAVTFAESGLPSGSTWGITVGTQPYTESAGSTLQLTVPVGTPYVYTSTIYYNGVEYQCAGQYCGNVVSAPGTITAAYSAVAYALTISTYPSSGGTTNPAPGTYWESPGASISITATPASGYSFSSWTCTGAGCASGTSAAISVTVNNPVNEVANFLASQFTTTINANGLSTDAPASTIIVTVDGTSYEIGQLPLTFTWSVGSSHTIVWTDNFAVQSGSIQYKWRSSSGLFTSESGTYVANSAGSITGNYAEQYYVITTANPTTGGSVSPSSGWYNAGSLISISATPAGSYTFNSWSSSTSSILIANTASQSTTATIDGAGTITAYFNAPVGTSYYTITFITSGLGSNVSSSSILTVDSVGYGYSQVYNGGKGLSFSWASGTIHSFAWASVVSGSSSYFEYNYVSSSGLSTAQSGTITVSGSGSVTATYQLEEQVTVTVYPSGDGTVSPSGTQFYPYGTMLSISERPSGSNTFSGWGATIEAGNLPIANTASQSTTATIDGAGTITAYFNTPPPPPPSTQYTIKFSVSGFGADASSSNLQALSVTTTSTSTYTISQLESGVSLYAPAGSTVSYSWTPSISLDSYAEYQYSEQSCSPGSFCTPGASSGSFTVSQDVTVVGTFTELFYVQVQASPSGGGTVSVDGDYPHPPGSGWYVIGTPMTFTESPSSSGGYQFTGWSGSCLDRSYSSCNTYSGSTATPVVTLTGPLSETANFWVEVQIVPLPGSSTIYYPGGSVTSGALQGVVETMSGQPVSGVTVTGGFVYATVINTPNTFGNQGIGGTEPGGTNGGFCNIYSANGATTGTNGEFCLNISDSDQTLIGDWAAFTGSSNYSPASYIEYKAASAIVEFTESGLPSGTSWTVSFSQTPIPGPFSMSSTTPINAVYSADYGFWDGSFSSSGGTPNPSSFNVDAIDSPCGTGIVCSYPGEYVVPSLPFGYVIQTSVSFGGGSNTLAFSETGLPSGTSWSVTVDGTQLSSTSSTITFSEPSGSHSYTVSTVACGAGCQYSPSPSSGSISVSGSTTVPVTFTEQSYVVFQSSPGGSGTISRVTGWYTTGQTVSIEAFPASGYAFDHWSSSTGALTFGSTTATSTYVGVGGTGTVTAYFVPSGGGGTVTFSETGLPSGVSWSVNFGGTVYTSSTSTLSITGLAPGTYAWSAPDPSCGTDCQSVPSPASGTMNTASQTSQTIAFITQYDIYFIAVPNGAGTMTVDGALVNGYAWIAAGFHTVTATPASGYFFTQWSTVGASGITFANPSSSSTTMTVNSAGTVNPTFGTFDFSLSAQSSSISGPQGWAGTDTINAVLTHGSGELVSFSATGGPVGTTFSFSSPSCRPTCSTTITVSTPSSAAAGTYTVSVTARGGGVTHSTTFQVIVESELQVASSPSSISAAIGGSPATSTITVSTLDGRALSASLAISGCPTNVTCSLSSTSGTTTYTSTLTVTASSSAAPGSYTLTITGASGSYTGTTQVSLSLFKSTFTLSASPTTVTVYGSEAATTTITASTTSGFSGQISWSISGQPSGDSWSMSECTPTCSTTLTIYTQASDASGSYTITVTGTSGSVVATTTFTLVINPNPSSLSFNPASLTGAAGTYSVTVTVKDNGAPGTYTFSASNVPTSMGYSVSFSPASCTVSTTGGSCSVTMTVVVPTQPGPATWTVSAADSTGPTISGSYSVSNTSSCIIRYNSSGPSWTELIAGTRSGSDTFTFYSSCTSDAVSINYQVQHLNSTVPSYTPENFVVGGSTPYTFYPYVVMKNPSPFGMDAIYFYGVDAYGYNSKWEWFPNYISSAAKLTVSVSPSQYSFSSLFPSPGTYIYTTPQAIQTCETPNPSWQAYIITSWGTGTSTSGLQQCLLMDVSQAQVDTENFYAQPSGNLELQVAPTSGGTTSGLTPGTYQYTAGTVVNQQICAVPSPGYMFTSWTVSGNQGYSGNDLCIPSNTITMYTSMIETANFAPAGYLVYAPIQYGKFGPFTGQWTCVPIAGSTCSADSNGRYLEISPVDTPIGGVAVYCGGAYYDGVNTGCNSGPYTDLEWQNIDLTKWNGQSPLVLSLNFEQFTGNLNFESWATIYVEDAGTGAVLYSYNTGQMGWDSTVNLYQDISSNVAGHSAITVVINAYDENCPSGSCGAPNPSEIRIHSFELATPQADLSGSTISFTGSGIQSGTTWYGSIGNIGYSSSPLTTSPIYLESGTYQWTLVSPLNGTTGVRYLPSPSSGTTTLGTTPDTISVSFTTQYYLTMASVGGTVSPSSGWYNAGTVVPISTTNEASTAYTFTGWAGTGTGSYTGTANPSSVTMNSPITENAQYALASNYIFYNTFDDATLEGWSYYNSVSNSQCFVYYTISSLYTNCGPTIVTNPGTVGMVENAIIVPSQSLYAGGTYPAGYIGVTKTVSLSSWSGTGPLVLAFDYEEVSLGTYTSGGGMYVTVLDGTTGTQLVQYNLAAPGANSPLYGQVSLDISSYVKGHSSITIEITTYERGVSSSTLYYTPDLYLDNIELGVYGTALYEPTGAPSDSTLSVSLTGPGSYSRTLTIGSTSTYSYSLFSTSSTSVSGYYGSPIFTDLVTGSYSYVFGPAYSNGSPGVRYLYATPSGTTTVSSIGPQVVTDAYSSSQYQVTLVSSNPSWGSVSPASGWYGSSPSPITATPASGYSFASWVSSSGSIVVNSPYTASTTFTTGAPGTITGNFMTTARYGPTTIASSCTPYSGFDSTPQTTYAQGYIFYFFTCGNQIQYVSTPDGVHFSPVLVAVQEAPINTPSGTSGIAVTYDSASNTIALVYTNNQLQVYYLSGVVGTNGGITWNSPSLVVGYSSNSYVDVAISGGHAWITYFVGSSQTEYITESSSLSSWSTVSGYPAALSSVNSCGYSGTFDGIMVPLSNGDIGVYVPGWCDAFVYSSSGLVQSASGGSIGQYSAVSSTFEDGVTAVGNNLWIVSSSGGSAGTLRLFTYSFSSNSFAGPTVIGAGDDPVITYDTSNGNVYLTWVTYPSNTPTIVMDEYVGGAWSGAFPVYNDNTGTYYELTYTGPQFTSNGNFGVEYTASGVLRALSFMNNPLLGKSYVTVNSNPGNGGTTSPTSGWFSPGSVAISATASTFPPYTFSSWAGSGGVTITSSTSASTTATISGPATITAEYTLPSPYLLYSTFSDGGLDGWTWQAGQYYPGSSTTACTALSSTGCTITDQPISVAGYTGNSVAWGYQSCSSSSPSCVSMMQQISLGSYAGQPLAFSFYTYDTLPCGSGQNVLFMYLVNPANNNVVASSSTGVSTTPTQYLLSIPASATTGLSTVDMYVFAAQTSPSGCPKYVVLPEYFYNMEMNAPFPTVVSETGLPAGTNWSVTFNGAAYSGTTSSFSVGSTIQGGYSYTTNPAAVQSGSTITNYAPSPSGTGTWTESVGLNSAPTTMDFVVSYSPSGTYTAHTFTPSTPVATSIYAKYGPTQAPNSAGPYTFYYNGDEFMIQGVGTTVSGAFDYVYYYEVSTNGGSTWSAPSTYISEAAGAYFQPRAFYFNSATGKLFSAVGGSGPAMYVDVSTVSGATISAPTAYSFGPPGSPTGVSITTDSSGDVWVTWGWYSSSVGAYYIDLERGVWTGSTYSWTLIAQYQLPSGSNPPISSLVPVGSYIVDVVGTSVSQPIQYIVYTGAGTYVLTGYSSSYLYSSDGSVGDTNSNSVFSVAMDSSGDLYVLQYSLATNSVSATKIAVVSTASSATISTSNDGRLVVMYGLSNAASSTLYMITTSDYGLIWNAPVAIGTYAYADYSGTGVSISSSMANNSWIVEWEVGDSTTLSYYGMVITTA